MTEFNRAHAAIFDELSRQGVQGVDIAKLASAVVTAKELIAAQVLQRSNPRCVSGSCDE